MAIANNTEDANDDNYSLQSPEPSEPPPISTPPIKVSNFSSWETSYTTTDDDMFHPSDERRRIYFLPPSPSSPPSPPGKLKSRLSLGMSFPKEGECSSTSTKPAARGSPQQRTSQVHRTGIRNIKDIPNSLMNYETYDFLHLNN